MNSDGRNKFRSPCWPTFRSFCMYVHLYWFLFINKRTQNSSDGSGGSSAADLLRRKAQELAEGRTPPALRSSSHHWGPVT